MITTPDLLLTTGGFVFTVSIWMQSFKTHHERSAREISWWFILFSLIGISFFVMGKVLLNLYYAAVVDIFGAGAIGWILYQKIKDGITSN